MHYSEVQGSHRERITQYKKFESLYDFSGVNFPASMMDVAKFEKQNSSKSFSVKVFGTYKEFGKNFPNVKLMSKTIRDKSRKVIDLLYVQEAELETGHYMGITSLTRLLGKHNCHKHFVC
jgi:hypothetical protein